jgi:hypothetical protein
MQTFQTESHVTHVFPFPLITIIKISVFWALDRRVKFSQPVDKVDVANAIIIWFRRLRRVLYDAL